MTVAAQSGRTTLKVAYFFSGIRCKASIAEALNNLCLDSGIEVEFTEIDILVGGAAHDLFDKQKQDDFLRAVEDGHYRMCILSPPWGTWSRANWANKAGPQPCRTRKNPWGLPGQTASQQRRADKGNEFVPFALRGIRAAQQAKRRGHWVRSFLDHPEDLGKTPRGTPASIWQFEDTRKVFGEFKAMTAAGHQCQFGVDRAKPTRIWSDILSLKEFGYEGWPIFDQEGWYKGPLPKSCGHNHKEKTIGKTADGQGFNISPSAA